MARPGIDVHGEVVVDGPGGAFRVEGAGGSIRIRIIGSSAPPGRAPSAGAWFRTWRLVRRHRTQVTGIVRTLESVGVRSEVGLGRLRVRVATHGTASWMPRLLGIVRVTPLAEGAGR